MTRDHPYLRDRLPDGTPVTVEIVRDCLVHISELRRAEAERDALAARVRDLEAERDGLIRTLRFTKCTCWVHICGRCQALQAHDAALPPTGAPE